MAPKRRARRPPLEVRSHVDGAWYDADVLLEGSRVRIHFNGFGSEDDEFWDEDCSKNTARIMGMMRLRSKQLQDSQCTMVSVGMVVCANFKTLDGHESKYYDAKVLMKDVVTEGPEQILPTKDVEIHQSQHSFEKGGKKELCKCRFKLAWEDGPYKHKEVFLGCADISLIDAESVEYHPVAHIVLQAARDFEEQSKGVGAEGPELVLPIVKDVEVNFDDTLSDDTPSENRSEVLFTEKDLEGLPPDIIHKVKNYEIFHEFLGKQAEKLKEALDLYNSRNNF